MAAARLLGFGPGEWARPLLREALGDRWALVRWTAARALASLQRSDTPIPRDLASQDPVVQAAEADALGANTSGDLMAALSPLLDASDVSVRQAAVEAVGRVADPSWVKPLIAVVRDADEETCVRRAAIRAICDVHARERTLAEEDVADALEFCLGDASPVIRACAVSAIGRLGLGACASLVDRALGDADVVVRWQAAGALARVGTAPNQRALRSSLSDREKVFGRTISGRVWAAMARIALRRVGERMRGLAAFVAEVASRRRTHIRPSDQDQ